MGGTTQYTVNNQMVNATLMNIADNPTNVQVAGYVLQASLNYLHVVVSIISAFPGHRTTIWLTS